MGIGDGRQLVNVRMTEAETIAAQIRAVLYVEDTTEGQE